jgi:serine/threonine-protein kinase
MTHRPDPAKTRALESGPADAAAERGRSAPARFAPGDLLGTRYRITALLAVGGMGEIYRADDLELGQPVAIKILPTRFARDAIMIARLRSEVRIARPIAHPNVVQFFDIAEVEGVHLLTMEYVDGQDLASIIAQSGPPPFETALHIARQICAGLAASHALGVLHRDLKPSNVLIDRTGRARLTDFGLAHAIGETPGPEASIGTPAYMSPEQLASGQTTIRSDIFSLGLLLFELFTGQAYFQTNALVELRRLHTVDPAVLGARDGINLDPAVRATILRCLQRDPLLRPGSVAEVVAGFQGPPYASS